MFDVSQHLPILIMVQFWKDIVTLLKNKFVNWRLENSIRFFSILFWTFLQPNKICPNMCDLELKYIEKWKGSEKYCVRTIESIQHLNFTLGIKIQLNLWAQILKKDKYFSYLLFTRIIKEAIKNYKFLIFKNLLRMSKIRKICQEIIFIHSWISSNRRITFVTDLHFLSLHLLMY